MGLASLFRPAPTRQRRATEPACPFLSEKSRHRLEGEILDAAAAPAGGIWEDRHWRNRIMAVAAFKVEGERRRRMEDDILSEAEAEAEATSRRATDETGMSSLHRRESEPGGRAQHGAQLNLNSALLRKAVSMPRGGNGAGRIGSPGGSHGGVGFPCSKSASHLSREDEEEMESILSFLEEHLPVQH